MDLQHVIVNQSDAHYRALVKELSAIAAWERRFDDEPDPVGRTARKLRRLEILRDLGECCAPEQP